MNNDNAPYEFIFHVIPAGIEQADGQCADCTDTADLDESEARIPARHGDTLRITVEGVSGQRRRHGRRGRPGVLRDIPRGQLFYLGSQTVKFRFVVMRRRTPVCRHDGELDYTRGDLDARAFNLDDDQFTTGEPRSVGRFG